MDDPRTRWNDDRLDDFYEDFRVVRRTVDQIPVMQQQLRGIDQEVKGARTSIHALREDIAARAVKDAVDRRTDRRWVIGTFLTTAIVIVGALQVLVGHL